MRRKFIAILSSLNVLPLLVSCGCVKDDNTSNSIISDSSTNSDTNSSNDTYIPSTSTSQIEIEDINIEPPPEDFNKHTFKTSTGISFPKFGTSISYSNNLSYILSEDKTYYICNGFLSGQDGNNVYIRDEYNGLPVKEISSEAFAYRWYVFNVYIPHSITSIGAGAFNACGIKKLYYDGNIDEFKASNWIFYPQGDDVSEENKVQNIDIYIGPNVTRIPSRFMLPIATHTSYVPRVNSLNFSSESIVESIGEYAFYNAYGLKEIYLPDSVKSIEEYAFYNTSIEEIYINDSVNYIAKNAFAMCQNLKYLRLSNNLEYIVDETFYFNSSLIYLDMSKTKIADIGDSAFKYCYNLSHVIFSDNLTTIEDSAFENNTSIKSLILPDSLTYLGKSAFKNCLSLSYLYLGENLKTLSNECFYGDINLSLLLIKSTYLDELSPNNKVFYGLNDFEILFFENVKIIPKRMFFNNDATEKTNIKRVDIYSSLEKIDDYALYNCNVDMMVVHGLKEEFDGIDISIYNNLPSEVFFK